MNKKIILLLSSFYLFGCDDSSGSGSDGDKEPVSPPSSGVLPPVYEEGDFGYWKTEFPETLKASELLNIYNSKNDVFKISYQDTSVSSNIFSTYIKMNEVDGNFQSNVVLGDGDLYSTGLQNTITGQINITKVDKSHINVDFSGLNHLGDPIDIEDHTMYLEKAASAGREATLPELDKSYTTISQVDIEYRGNGEIYALNTFSGCWFTATVQPSGFTILSSSPANATDYEPWAFDFEVLPENTNCTTVENQAGMINLYYGAVALSGYDEISLQTIFNDYALFNIGMSDMNDRPEGY